VKIDQLVAAAWALFNRKGVDGVALDEISTAVGATKGAVYRYFTDKADLVVRCYLRAFDLYEQIMAAADNTGPRAIDRVLASLHLNIQAQAGALSPMMLQPGFFNLPADVQIDLARRADQLRRASTRLLRQGMADGTCRELDAAYAAEVAAGIFLWLPKWYQPTAGRPAKAVADEISNAFTFGVLRR
jgi:AcrR family transcriptional regulator